MGSSNDAAGGMSVDAASRSTGIRASVLRDHIAAGDISCVDGIIPKSSLDEIQEQQEKYVSLRDFLRKYDNDRFSSGKAADREKFIDFMEEHGCFGIEITCPEQIFYSVPGKDEIYLLRADVDFLDYESRTFFEDYGISEEEKVRQLLLGCKTYRATYQCIIRYLSFIEDKENIYTPSLTDFVRIVYEIPDIRRISDDDVIAAIEAANTERTKNYLVGFFIYVSNHEEVAYHKIELKKTEKEAEPAYDYEEFVRLAKILFNTDYDRTHDLTRKALDDSWYAEMWMFLSCHYVCGWRASDICSRWVYPGLKDNNNPFGVHVETLKDDILNEKITDSVYENIALYTIRRIEMAYNVPQKTGRGKLRSEMVPELRLFFGKLSLIAEYHHLRSGEGYMKPCRTAHYRNWVACREFFGEEIFVITGTHSISSRRLNKSYLQGLEQAARGNGNPSLVSHVVAAYARSHADADTTAIYLRDHGLTGETAGVVLFMMMQRGVFGVSLYHALIMAFPGAFTQLTLKEQSLLMEQVPLSAFELETAGNVLAAAEEMSTELSRGNTEVPVEVLKAMLSIGQGQGKAKEEGVYCCRKALGLCCDRPLYESCIANLCPNHIFTKEGIPALVRVIKDYGEKYRTTGNRKYRAAMEKCIIPAFQEVINEIIRGMPESERSAMKALIGEALNE